MFDIDFIWNFLVAQVKTNQFLTGATLTGMFAGVLYFLRDKIFRFWAMVKRFFNVSITIHSEDPLYIPVSSWLYAHNFDKFARNYRIRYVDGKATYGPAEGTFLFFHKRQLLRISITKEQQGTAQSWRSQTREFLSLSYYSLHRSKDVINEIIADALVDYNSASEGVPVYARGSFVTRIPRRKNPSVVLAGTELEKIEADVEHFLGRKDWYLDRGIPYHRGYLLTGPPGTGKTSLVRHLAQKFGLPVYVSDGTIRSITCTPPRSILLMEDVDSISKMREFAQTIGGAMAAMGSSIEGSVQSTKSTSEDIFAPSLSELLNALDGVASSDETVVIMTTNLPELLDPAILRPGRVDYRLHLGPCTAEQAVRMFTKFYGPEHSRAFEQAVLGGAITPAQLQEIFISSSNEQHAIHTVQEMLKETLAA